MNEPVTNQSIFEIYNARHKTPEEVAATFVPPQAVFEDLTSRNNHILVGPRGSGKTTLLKMLTIPACYAASRQANALSSKPNFIGIFIPADNGWNVQINDNTDNNISVGIAAFTTHILMAFTQALIDAKNYSRVLMADVTPPAVTLNAEQEVQFVKLMSEPWKLKPPLSNLEGLKLALRSRLLELHDLKKSSSVEVDVPKFLLERAPYITLDFKQGISLALDTYESITKIKSNAWAFLFDEFEIAPPYIQKEVLDCMRGNEDGRLIYKIALAPYNETFIQNSHVQKSFATHDFTVINLWYPDKKAGREFSEHLLKAMLVKEGILDDSLWNALGTSSFNEEDDKHAYSKGGDVLKAFDELLAIDESFKQYFDNRHLNTKLQQWEKLDEADKATIRKIRSVVITRNIFLRAKHSDNSLQRRSRKNHVLYKGFPTIVELCEGNPRALIGMFTPLFRKLRRYRNNGNGKSVAPNLQATVIQYAASSFRSLLKTIGYQTQLGVTKSLLHLLDDIGEHFRLQCVGQTFHPEPTLSFIVDSNCDKNVMNALGRALNAGAIIYIPDQKSDPIMGSLAGKRFRLNYILAAYYGLPILLGTATSLNSILKKSKDLDGTLFTSVGSDD